MSKGITISVTAETNAGGRRHMEDYLAVKLCPNEELRAIPHLKEQAYIGVFDGHGGKEAAKFARERLWDLIQSQPKFRQDDVKSVRDSIEDAFIALHAEMEPMREKWKRNKMGDLSTAGTTASTVIFRQNHIYVANVGDSTAILALANPQAGEAGQHPVLAKVLTKDHKPEDPAETELIKRLGGQVMLSRKRVPRVVWERVRTISNKESDEKTTQVDFIPFLSVSRSLGDFWSYNPRTRHFVVSPRPDVYVHNLDPKQQKFIVIASDGLWNVMSPKEVVEFIWDYEHNQEECHQPKDVVRAIINEALKRWSNKNLLADNIAVLIAFLSEGEEQSPSVAGIRSMDEPSTSSAESATSTPSPIRESPPVAEGGESSTSGSTAYCKETYSDGVTIEYHTKVKLRPRGKRQRTADSAKKTGVKRERPDDVITTSPAKKVKVDSQTYTVTGQDADSAVDKPLTDSGCDVSEDHSMDVLPPATDHASSDQSSGVFSDDDQPSKIPCKSEEIADSSPAEAVPTAADQSL